MKLEKTIARPDLEELLPDIQQCVSRYQAGRLEAISAALEGGALLAMAREQLLRGDWILYLDKAGVNRMTANRWMRLSALGMWTSAAALRTATSPARRRPTWNWRSGCRGTITPTAAAALVTPPTA